MILQTLALQFRLARPAAWRQLLAFCAVGASGYAVNLAVYTLLLGLGVHFRPAACGAFAVAVCNNYAWNRRWTFGAVGGSQVPQAARFLVVSLSGLALNVAVLDRLVAAGAAVVVSQAAAIALVAPASFLGNKLWSFAR